MKENLQKQTSLVLPDIPANNSLQRTKSISPGLHEYVKLISSVFLLCNYGFQ